MTTGLFSRIRKYFGKKREERMFRDASTEQVFTHIYLSNKWGDAESRSGKGSNLEVTALLREELPGMLRRLQVRTMLDIPCGDFHWMKEVDLPLERYQGADIVQQMIVDNQRRYGNASREFLHLDLLRDDLPAVDAIFCRECLVHLSFADIARALENIRRSGAIYLFTTQFPDIRTNTDVVTGKHHSLNFTRAPFHWPEPVLELVEYHAGKRRGNKCLSVWRIAELPVLAA